MSICLYRGYQIMWLSDSVTYWILWLFCHSRCPILKQNSLIWSCKWWKDLTVWQIYIWNWHLAVDFISCYMLDTWHNSLENAKFVKHLFIAILHYLFNSNNHSWQIIHTTLKKNRFIIHILKIFESKITLTGLSTLNYVKYRHRSWAQMTCLPIFHILTSFHPFIGFYDCLVSVLW